MIIATMPIVEALLSFSILLLGLVVILLFSIGFWLIIKDVREANKRGHK